jgi:hypothetical protein
MGAVLQFPRSRLRYRPEDIALLSRLAGSWVVIRQGGSVEVGEPGGVVVVRKQHVLGVWGFASGQYHFFPVCHGVRTLVADSVEDAHDATVTLLGAESLGG